MWGGRNELRLDLGDRCLQVLAPGSFCLFRKIVACFKRALQRGKGRTVHLFAKGPFASVALFERLSYRIFYRVQGWLPSLPVFVTWLTVGEYAINGHNKV